MPDVVLKVGSVEFLDMEAPAKFGDLGAVQALALHEFAGGIRSIQLFGSFPRPQRWSGILIGRDAHSRARTMKQLVTSGEATTLEWNGWSFFGIMAEFEIQATESLWELQYNALFEPAEDSSTGATSGPAVAPSSLLPFALEVANNQASKPASGAILDPSIPAQVDQLKQAVNQSLLQNGNLSSIPPATVFGFQQQVNTLRQTLALGPLLSVNQGESLAARELDQTLRVIDWLLDNSLPPLAEINVQNPNLFVLAAAHYDGDVDKWELIAKANGLLTPYPIGTYRLVIPADIEKPKSNIPVFI